MRDFVFKINVRRLLHACVREQQGTGHNDGYKYYFGCLNLMALYVQILVLSYFESGLLICTNIKK